MVKAYIMLVTATGTTQDVLPEIAGIDGVTEVNAIAGDYDVIAEVELDEVSELLPTISSKIQGIDGVGATKTYISLS